MDSCARDDGDTPNCSPSPPPKDHEQLTPVSGIKGDAVMTPSASTPANMTPQAMTHANTTPAPSQRRRTRRNTIFNEDCSVEELSQKKLEQFFQVKPAAVDCRPRSSVSGTATGPVRTLITDPK